MKTIRIGAAQINSTVGDLKGNYEKVTAFADKALSFGADIVAFPELALTGYPPEDLLLKGTFIEENLQTLHRLAAHITNITAIIGFVDREEDRLYNAAAVLQNGRIMGICRKELLPNYGVFDEKRYFSPGDSPLLFCFGDARFGVSICEDIWYKEGPARFFGAMGADIVFNINASPYHAGKHMLREEAVKQRIRENRFYLSYVNLVGGQDELVFDGQSFIMDPKGNLMTRSEAFKEDLLLADIPVSPLGAGKGRTTPPARYKKASIISLDAESMMGEKPNLKPRQTSLLDPVAEVYEALKLGLHDYVAKNGFKQCVIGLSGGIDSALVAVLAADALGNDNVKTVFMPSRYTSNESEADALELAENLGIECLRAPIDGPYRAYIETLSPFFAGHKEDITEENLQARIRGNILMALSNKFGWLVLTTGNKSEMSVGYATLYGDMAGGFAVIKDVPKTLVYELSRYRNGLGRAIPRNILEKAPTAELKPDQKDSDTLPPYDLLDPVLKDYIEEDREIEEITSPPLSKEEIARVLRMVDNSEYKRRQSPPGIKITPKAFGKDRRMPITNRYRGKR